MMATRSERDDLLRLIGMDDTDTKSHPDSGVCKRMACCLGPTYAPLFTLDPVGLP